MVQATSKVIYYLYGINAFVLLPLIEAMGKKLAAAFADATDNEHKEESSKGDNLILPSGHGALFHLNQLAYYQLLHRAGGDPVKGIELSRWAVFTDEPNELPDNNIQLKCSKSDNPCYLAHLRYVDIVLGINNFDEQEKLIDSTLEEDEKWIELKSWAASSDKGEGRNTFAEEKRRGDFTQWTLGVGGRPSKTNNFSPHKQFTLDRAAANLGVAWLTKRESQTRFRMKRQAVSQQFEWRFQSFKVTDKNKKVHISARLGRSHQKNNPRAIRWLFAQPALVDNSPRVKDVLNESTGSGNHDTNRNVVDVGNVVVTAMKDMFKQYGFDDVVQDIAEEFPEG